MREELITFETAVLAKGKGCELELFTGNYLYEDEYGDTFSCNFEPKDNSKKRFNLRKEVACSQSLLQKWLRDTHGLDVEIEKYRHDRTGRYYKARVWGFEMSNEGYLTGFDAHETALEAALQTALKLIV